MTNFSVDRLVRVGAPALAGIIIVAKSVSTAAAPVTMADTYLHLRFGEMFRSAWTPWHPGQLDAFASNRWYPTQWLSQIVMSWIDSAGGLAAIAWTYELFLLALLVSWYLTARRMADPLVAAVVTGLAFAASSGSLSARPQLGSFLLVTVLVLGLNHARETRRTPWWLVPFGWFWAMVHGMWIIGVAIAAVAMVAMVLEARLPRRALAVPVGMFAVATITPAGPGLVGAVLLVGNRSAYITEWASPTLASPYEVAVLALVGSALVAMTRGRPAPTYNIAMVTLAGLFAVYSIRTVPVAACLSLPFAAQYLQALVGKAARPRRREYALLAGGCGLALAITAFAVPHTSTDPPVSITAFTHQLDSLPDGAVVVTDWPDGGPLMWVEPRLDVPVQGYVDVLTDDELQSYSNLMALGPGWDHTLRTLHPAAALLPDTSALAYALRHDGWQVAGHQQDRYFLTAPAR